MQLPVVQPNAAGSEAREVERLSNNEAIPPLREAGLRVDRLQHESPPDDLLKVPEAARRLGINPETLYRLIKAGKFPPAIRIGASIRVSVPRLEQFLHGDAR